MAEADSGRRVVGRDRGLFEVPDNFDAPLPKEVLDEFERCDELLAPGNVGGACDAERARDQGVER